MTSGDGREQSLPPTYTCLECGAIGDPLRDPLFDPVHTRCRCGKFSWRLTRTAKAPQ